MAISAPVFKPADTTVTISNADKVLITNLSLPIINTEVGHSLQTGLKSLIIKNRMKAKTNIAFILTESSTNYLTLEGGAVLSLQEIDFTGKTIYLQSTAISTIEIVELYV